MNETMPEKSFQRSAFALKSQIQLYSDIIVDLAEELDQVYVAYFSQINYFHTFSIMMNFKLIDQ